MVYNLEFLLYKCKNFDLGFEKQKRASKMTEKINYVEAFNELQLIVQEIEDGEITVDELALKVKRAAALIKICKSKLSSTEEDVNQILKELENEN